jgi:glycosyltransferase involved in cell wall biosynthesis
LNKLSISCIGHNEEKHIKQLLPKLLEVADEVIYVDCESSDNSYEIAKELGCRVFRQPNNSNLNVNKSYGIEQTKNEWVIYIDPDERLTDELLKEIRDTINSNPIENGFKISRRNFFFGKWLKHGGQYPDNQLRLFRSKYAKFPQKHVHERIQISGTTGKLKHDLIHHPYCSIAQLLHKFHFYTSFDADFLSKKNTPLNFKNHVYYLFYKPFSRFVKRFFLRGGFVDGIPGFVAAFIDSAGWIVRYVKLWELRKGHNILEDKN